MAIVKNQIDINNTVKVIMLYIVLLQIYSFIVYYQYLVIK